MFSKVINCCAPTDPYNESEKSSARAVQIEHGLNNSTLYSSDTVNIRVALFTLQECTEYLTFKIGKHTTVKELEKKLRDQCQIGNSYLKIVALPQGFTTKLSTKLHMFHLTCRNTKPIMDAMIKLVDTSRKNYTKSIRAINKHQRRQDSLDWVRHKIQFKSNRHFNPAHERNERYAQMMKDIPLPGRVFDKQDSVLHHIRVEEDKEGIAIHVAVIPYFDGHEGGCEEGRKVHGIHNRKTFAKIDRAIWKLVFWTPLI